MAGALLGADRSASNWQLLLEGGGILLTEDTAAKTLVEGLNEKEAEAGITLSIDPSTAYATVFIPVDKNFCSRFDQAIVELAPNFLDANEQPFEGDLEILANLVGDEHAITYLSDGSPLESYRVAISSAYITQRLAMLNLFVTPAMDIYSMPCIVKSAKVILPTETYMEDQDGTWSSQDVTIATMSNDVVTVVSEGVCEFEFTGTDPNNSGTITAYCLLNPDINVVKNCAAVINYASTDTGHSVTIQMSNQGVLTLNGTMSQNAEFTVCPYVASNNSTFYSSDDISGNLLLWCEEISGSCEVSSGRVCIEFCSFHPTSGHATVVEYELELYSTLQIAQHTHAKLIHNADKNIRGIRIFASKGTVFNNYQIRIGVKKYPSDGLVYDAGLLEPYLLSPNNYAIYHENLAPTTRLCDGSLWVVMFPNNVAKLWRYSHTFMVAQQGPAAAVTGDAITEVGKAYRFTIRIVESDNGIYTRLYQTSPAYFNLYYVDGEIAASINVANENSFTNGVATTTFISEKVVDFLGFATVIGGSRTSEWVRLAFKLEEINIDDLDLEGLTLYTDSKIVNQQDIKVVYEPAAIIGSPIASALTWSSSNDEIATVDENGHITVHSDGECTFTATSVKTPSISATVTAMCYYAQDDNMVANLVKISQATYSQGGITIKHNADGTITFNGTTTNSNTSYYRNVIWPLGNSKTVWNVFFPRQGISGTWLLWWEYVSGSIEGTSTFTGGSVSHELYVINHNGTEILKIQAKYTSPDDTDREKYCKSMTSTDGIRLVSWGFQMAKGTKFNNYTVRVGIKKFANLDYHGDVLEEFLCALTGYKKFATNKTTIWTRFPDGSIGGYLDESVTAFPSASGYVRLTEELAYANNVSSILTDDKIGIAGHNYRLNVNLIKFKYDRIAATELKFGVAYADGTPAGEITIIDPATFVSSGTNIDLSGTTYNTTFQAAEQLNCAYQYFNQLKVKGKEEYFAISLSDLDTMIIAYGQIITIIENDAVSEDITVNYGGRLNVSSGVTLPKVTENGGYVYINQATVTFVPNTITDLEITGKNSATLHSGTILESSVINGSSAFVDVSSGGSASDIAITSGGKMYVYNNGIASNIEVNEGSCFVYGNAGASDITLNSGALLVVSNYGTISNVTINPDAYAYAYGSDVHCYNVVENGGYLDIPDDQDPIESIIVPNHVSGISTSKYTAHSGTTLTDITGSYGIIYNSGIVNSVTLRYIDELIVSSGGTALNVIEDGGSLWDYDGVVYTIVPHTMTGTIGSGCWNGITVHSNTVVSDATIVNDYLDIYSGGIGSNIILEDYGEAFISSGGSVTNISAVDGTGEVYVEPGGYVSNIRLSSGGYIEVSSGGTALDVENVPFTGLIFSHAGASVTYDSNLSGVYWGHSGQVASSANRFEAETINDSNGNRMEVYSGGTAKYCAVRAGGYLQINSGGLAYACNVYADQNMVVMNGAWVYNQGIQSGILHVREGGVVNSVTLQTSNNHYRMIVYPGGIVQGSINLSSDCSALISSGGVIRYTLYDMTPNASSSARVRCLGRLDMEDPIFEVRVTSNNVNGVYNLAYPASTFESYPINVYKDEVSAGIVTLEDSLITSDKEFSLSVSGNTLMLTQTTYIPPVSGTIVNAGETLTVLPYEKYIDTTISGGTMLVSSEGKASSTVVNRGGQLIISSGAQALHVIENGGDVYSVYGAITTFEPHMFSGLVMTSDGSEYASNTTVHSGTTALDITVNYNCLYVYNGGVASSAIVNAAGSMIVSSGGTAVIVENGGYVYVVDGASATFIPNIVSSRSDKSYTVHSGTTVLSGYLNGGYHADVFSGGSVISASAWNGGIRVSFGGYIESACVDEGSVDIKSGAIVNNLDLKDKNDHRHGKMFLSGYASNVIIHSKSVSNIIASGGTLTGKIMIESGGTITVSSGGSIVYDLTTVLPETSTIISGYSSILGEPSYTLVLADNQSSGTYNLADGLTSEGFHDYIRLYDTSNTELGHVGNGVDCAIESDRYTLDTVNETSLALSKGGWDLIVDGDSKVSVSGSYGNVLVRYGDLSCYSGTIIDNLQVLYGGYVTANGTNFVISNCAEHGGNIVQSVASRVQHFAPNVVSNIETVSGKNINIHSGTTITSIMVNYPVKVNITSGASVIHPVIDHGASVFVSSGATVVCPTYTENKTAAWTVVSSGGTALQVNTEYLHDVSVCSGGYVEWFNTENNLVVVSSGTFDVSTDMTNVSYLITQYGTLNATSGAALSNVIICGKSNILNISSGASASRIHVELGTANISDGGTVDSLTLVSSAVINIVGNATVSKIGDVSYNNYAYINISSGATFDGNNGTVGKYNTVTVYSGGSFINASGTALYIDGKSGCYISHVMPQQGHIRVTVAPDTYMNVYNTYGWETMENAYFSGGIVRNDTGGIIDSVTVLSGGTAEDITISAGAVTVSSGGVLTSVIMSGGTLTVASDGSAINVTSSGGTVVSANGAYITYV